MNLYFRHIAQLDTHIRYLQDTVWVEDVFLVGWVVRDSIIWKKKKLLDIDLTMAWHPDVIWKGIQTKYPKRKKEIDDNTDTIDMYRTEKFGTMTVIRTARWNDETLISEANQASALSVKQWGDINNVVKYEITPFREESGYSDARHPDSIVWSNSLLADAGRRDFTINAMYYSRASKVRELEEVGKAREDEYEDVDIELLLKTLKSHWFAYLDTILIIQHHTIIEELLPNGKLSVEALHQFLQKNEITQEIEWIIWDPYLWLQDIVDGRIRCVGSADKRFNEDALRILRAIRFQNTLNFDPDLDAEFDYEKETWKSMKKYYYLIKHLSKERIHEEIQKVFSGPNPFGYVAVLDELNLLKYIFPSVVHIKHLIQPVRYHPFDVYSHSLLALHYLQSINTNYLVRLAMLYHDVGKSEQYYTHTFGLDNDDRSYIYGGWLNHVNCGQDMAKEDLERVGFGRKEIEEVMWYIGQHMKPGEILMSKQDNRVKKMREIYTNGGYERTKNLLDICRGDRSGHFNPIQKPAIDGVLRLYEILDNLKESEGQFTMSKMDLDGNDLMQEFGLQPGRKIGELMKKAFEWVMEDIKGRNKKDKIIEKLRMTL